MSLDALRGRVAFVFEEADFDVDQIVGVENIRLTDPDALAACAMRRFDPGFAEQVEPGDVVVGAENFGYGHPHFAPMIGLRRLGVRAVIAESFATGYWREEIAEGFPQIACPGITGLARRWDEIEIDWEAAQVRNMSRGGAARHRPLLDRRARHVAGRRPDPLPTRETQRGRERLSPQFTRGSGTLPASADCWRGWCHASRAASQRLRRRAA